MFAKLQQFPEIRAEVKPLDVVVAEVAVAEAGMLAEAVEEEADQVAGVEEALGEEALIPITQESTYLGKNGPISHRLNMKQ